MANEYLQRTPTSAGNRKVWTFSAWVKINKDFANADYNTVWSVAAGTSADNNDRFHLYHYLDGIWTTTGTSSFSASFTGPGGSTASSRDPSSWMHICLSVDTTVSSLIKDKIQKFWVNGIEYNYDDLGNIAANANLAINGLFQHFIGRRDLTGSPRSFDGEMYDVFLVDGQALTPDVFGFYKQGKGYISAGSTQATDFRPGQWVPKSPQVIKREINSTGGFGVNGFYLPMNDSTNFGADFHCDPNSIIKLNEDLTQPKVGVARTATVGLGYTDVLRSDPFAANLVLALPFVSSGLCTSGTTVGINTGFGDYSHIIRGSGSAKVGVTSTAVSIATTAGYYGSAVNYQNNSAFVEFSGTSGDFNMGTGDFTVEGWFNPLPIQTTNARLFGQDTNASGEWDVYISGTSANGSIAMMGGAYTLSSVGFSTGNQWHHFAMVRKNLVFTTYINGVATGILTTYTGTVGDSTNIFRVGATGRNTSGTVDGAEYSFQGYIQDFRVYKGVAKYTGGFDVPNHYTPVGIATWRAVSDTTANNFCTWNPVSPASDVTYTNGNLTVAYGSNATWGVVTGTVGIAVTGAGKYYWENRIDASSISPTAAMPGVWGMSTSTSAARYPGNPNTYGWSYFGFDGNFYAATGGSTIFRSYGASFTTGDIIGVSLDMTTNNGSLEFYKNGVSQGVATTGIGTFLTNGNIHALMPAIGDGSSGNTYTASTNFGQNPTFSGNTTAGTFTDSNGKGLFKYQPPSGFLALCEDNLPTPPISDPGKYFKTVLYSGDNASSRSVVGVGFTPDLVWLKSRNNGSAGHRISDSVRGGTLSLTSAWIGVEGVDNNGNIGAFNSDGFSVLAGSTNSAGVNASGENYVAWCWRAGAGTTSTNTNGSITSVVSVNQDAGFSIVSYTGTGANATVGHGLGKVPKFMLFKNRSVADGWIVYHSSIPATQYLQLNTTSAVATLSSVFNDTAPTSNVFSVGTVTNTNGSTNKLIAYCWAEIEGYSKAFSYVGNGSADGPFIFLNFKPAFIIIKRTDNVGNWQIYDSSRGSTNPNNGVLFPNLNNVEGTSGYDIDFLSNGFKLRSTDTDRNASGSTYIGMAFAESPFPYSNAK